MQCPQCGKDLVRGWLTVGKSVWGLLMFRALRYLVFHTPGDADRRILKTGQEVAAFRCPACDLIVLQPRPVRGASAEGGKGRPREAL